MPHIVNENSNKTKALSESLLTAFANGVSFLCRSSD